MIKRDDTRMPDPTAASKGIFQIFDPLVGAYDRTYLPNVLSAVGARHHSGESTSCLMISLDAPHEIRDLHGHAGEAAAIREVAAVAFEIAGGGSYVVRYHRAVLCLLIPNVRLSSAVELAHRIRHSIAVNRIQLGAQTMMVTVSVGVATAEHLADIENFAIIEAAEAALNAATRRANTVDTALIAA